MTQTIVRLTDSAGNSFDVELAGLTRIEVEYAPPAPVPPPTVEPPVVEPEPIPEPVPEPVPEPADVTVAVGALAGVSAFESGVSHVNADLTLANNSAEARAKDALRIGVRWHGVHLQNFGVGQLAPWDGAGAYPTTPNMASFDQQAGLAAEMGGKLIVALYNMPWWLRGKTTFANGVQTTTRYTSAQAFETDGRLLTDMKGPFHILMVAALRHILRVHGCRHFVTHNEYKGYQFRSRDNVGQAYDHDAHPGTPAHADMGFCEQYRLWAVALTEACAQEGIALADVRLYGPYTVIRSQGGANDADSVPVGHPLRDCVWGTMNKQGINAASFFVNWAKTTGIKFDGFSLDYALGNKDNIFRTTDSILVADVKTADVLTWARSLLTAHGYPATFPMLASELYDNLQGTEVVRPPEYRVAMRSVLFMSWIKNGGWLPLWWGPVLASLVTDTDTADGGAARPFLTLQQMFHTYFSLPYTPLHAVTTGDARVHALATSTHVALQNVSADTLTVDVGAARVVLDPYALRVVEV